MNLPAELAEALSPRDYTEIELAGKGGSGSVYRAHDQRTGQPVAVKVLHFPDPRSAARTQREIDTMQAVSASPHVARLLQGRLMPAGDAALLIYEWVEGRSLQYLLDQHRGPLSFAEWTSIATQLCAGLVHLHACNVLHRDVKPSNVMLAEDGVVKLTDFGLAMVNSLTQEMTIQGTFVGTLRYSAPETISGARPTPATDAYAFGMTVLYMALGRMPLAESGLPNLIRQILAGAAVEQAAFADLGGLAAMVRSLLAANPQERPSLSLVLEHLRAARRGPEPETATVRRLLERYRGTAESVEPPTVLADSLAATVQMGTVPGLLQSLAAQMNQVHAAVADMTARFSVTELKPRDEGPPEIELAIRGTFDQLSRRLATTWKTSLVMTCVLFSLTVVLVVLAVVMGLIYKQSMLSLVFGAGGAASVFTVILWKPIDKLLLITVATQQLDIVKINFQRALAGSSDERRAGFKDVSVQLESLLSRMVDLGSAPRSARRRKKA